MIWPSVVLLGVLLDYDANIHGFWRIVEMTGVIFLGNVIHSLYWAAI